MKNFVKWFGIIALVAVIGFAFTACEETPKDELDGTTWKATYTYTIQSNTQTAKYTLTCKSPNFTIITVYPDGHDMTQTGTYKISGSTVTFKTSTGGSYTATLSGNKLTMKSSEIELVYTKQ